MDIGVSVSKNHASFFSGFLYEGSYLGPLLVKRWIVSIIELDMALNIAPRS